MRSMLLVSAGVSLMVLLGCAAAEPPDGSALPGDARERVVHLRSSLSVLDRVGAVAALRDLVEDRGGFVASSESSGGYRSVLELRVPVLELDALRRELDRLDGGRTESESTEDVTAAHADLEARLRSARATESRLLTLLSERTAALADVLAAERELERVRERIEQLDAEDRAVRERVALAYVQLDLVDVGTSFVDAPGAAIAAAFEGGLRVTWTVVVAALVVSSALLPAASALAALALVSALGWRRVRALH